MCVVVCVCVYVRVCGVVCCVGQCPAGLHKNKSIFCKVIDLLSRNLAKFIRNMYVYMYVHTL